MNWTLVICCSVAVVAAFLVHGSAAQTIVGLGETCQNTFQCNITVPNSNCSSSKCVCTDRYQPTGDSKLCTLKLNETCSATRICNQTGAVCFNNKCSCVAGNVISSNGSVCLNVVGMLGYACQDSKQCSVKDAVCSSSKCVCKQGLVQNSLTTCISPGSTTGCSSTKQCSNNFECRVGYCTCPGVISGGSCRIPVLKLGEKCDEKTQVCWQTVGGDTLSSCKSGKCTCNKRYAPNKEKTQCTAGASSVLASTALLLIAFVASRKLM